MLSVLGGDTPLRLTNSVLTHFIRRAVRAGLYPADGPNLHQLVSDGDEALFPRILVNQHHVLQQLLPNTTTHNYGLYAVEGTTTY